MAGAGIASSVAGALTKQKGAQANSAAMDMITMDEINRLRDMNMEADKIAQWYGGQSDSLFKDTFSRVSPDEQARLRATSEADRTARGVNLISSAADPHNATVAAGDSTGAVAKANAAALAAALERGKKEAAAGAKVNSYGDAGLETGIRLARAAMDQGGIQQVAGLRSRLNKATHTPVLSADAKYRLASGAGQGDFDTGSALMAGGSVLSAGGAYGLGKDAWDWAGGLFGKGAPGGVNTGIGMINGTWFG